MAANQPSFKDLSVLDVGTKRTKVVKELGQPVWTENGEGSYVDYHAFTQGYPDAVKAFRATCHTIGDIGSFGLWELAGVPMERFLDGTDYAVAIQYDAEGRVEKVESVHEDRLAVWEDDSVHEQRTRLDSTLYDRRVAVVIGIDKYRSGEHLHGARRDAEKVYETLGQMGFTVHRLYDEEASREAILRLLGDVIPRETTPRSLALVYFAGHGVTESVSRSQALATPEQGTRGYILPADGDPKYPYATGISMGTLSELRYRVPAKHLYYVMDSCYSGLGLAKTLRPGGGQARYFDLLASSAGVTMMTAGKAGENAFEVENTGGVFSNAFLDALGGAADTDNDDRVTATEIARFVQEKVYATTNGEQSPQYGNLEGAGEPILEVNPTVQVAASANTAPETKLRPRGPVPDPDNLPKRPR